MIVFPCSTAAAPAAPPAAPPPVPVSPAVSPASPPVPTTSRPAPAVVWNSDDEEERELRRASGYHSEEDEEDDDTDHYSITVDDDVEELDDDEQLDYVSQHNTSQDSSMDEDAPLSQYVASHAASAPAPASASASASASAAASDWKRNKPGTPGFQWRDAENVPSRYGFDGSPGVRDPDLSIDSTPLDCFRAFLTKEIWGHIVKETNR